MWVLWGLRVQGVPMSSFCRIPQLDEGAVGDSRAQVGLVRVQEFRGSLCLPRLPQLAAAVGLVAEISRQLGQRRAEAEAEIGSSFEELEAALRQRREVLLRDLEATCAAKQQVTHLCLSALIQPFLGGCVGVSATPQCQWPH